MRTLYVRNIRFNVVLWIDMRHSFIKCSLISYLQTSLKHGLVHFISISYVLAKSSALVIQLVNPCSCKRFKLLYTCFTNYESGIWCNRLKKLNNDTWHDKLGGNVHIHHKQQDLIIEFGMKLLIHSQTSTVLPLKFGNALMILSHTLQ